eukprot:3523530-Pyramimonas_sp.AAC.1
MQLHASHMVRTARDASASLANAKRGLARTQKATLRGANGARAGRAFGCACLGRIQAEGRGHRRNCKGSHLCSTLLKPFRFLNCISTFVSHGNTDLHIGRADRTVAH